MLAGCGEGGAPWFVGGRWDAACLGYLEMVRSRSMSAKAFNVNNRRVLQFPVMLKKLIVLVLMTSVALAVDSAKRVEQR